MSWSSAIDHMVTIIEAGTDLNRAPVAFSAEDIPDTLAGRVFCWTSQRTSGSPARGAC